MTSGTMCHSEGRLISPKLSEPREFLGKCISFLLIAPFRDIGITGIYNLLRLTFSKSITASTTSIISDSDFEIQFHRRCVIHILLGCFFHSRTPRCHFLSIIGKTRSHRRRRFSTCQVFQLERQKIESHLICIR